VTTFYPSRKIAVKVVEQPVGNGSFDAENRTVVIDPGT
jgi:hypothetical protein